MGINNEIRAYNSFVLLVDSDPSIAPGATAGVGSMATDASGVIYKKIGKLDTDWVIFYNPASAPLNNSYGSFYDTSTQNNLIANNLMTYNTTTLSSGVSINGGSQITFTKAGVFNVQFSAQIEKTGGGPSEIEIWLRKDGVDDIWSNTATYIQGNNQKFVLAWNFFIEITAPAQYVELVWYSIDPTMQIVSQIPGARPGIPSIILTVNQVGS